MFVRCGRSAVAGLRSSLAPAQRPITFTAAVRQNRGSSEAVPEAPEATQDESSVSRRDYRFIFPEFIPDPNPAWRNPVRERLERRDMINRREQIEIPEFYVGSYMSVTATDETSPHPNKLARFVGICIDRGGCGTRAWFILRNVVEGQGVELMYHLYNPTLVKIEVLRLEKRLDDELYYLRDAPPEYSQVPFDMEAEILPEGSSVPVNKTVVKLNPRPWLKKWERFTGYFQGYELTDPFATPGKIRQQIRWMAEGNDGWQMETLKYDLMRDYRNTVPSQEQEQIWEEVGDQLESRDVQMRKVAAKKAFVRPVKKH